MQSQKHPFELPSSIGQEVQFCSFENFVVCTVQFQLLYPVSYNYLKHILDKFRLYCFSECGSPASLESAIFQKVFKVSEVLSLPLEYQLSKKLIISLTIPLYFNDKVESKIPAPGHLTVNFFPVPGHLPENFSRPPGICTQKFR